MRPTASFGSPAGSGTIIEAIRAAIREYEITNPEHQKRLAAQRMD
jgi:hypothetical protein